MNNCSCGSSRCLLKVYVEDGVPLKIRTDEQDEDSIEVPQRRACPRGRAQIGNILSPARIKYPMKRKGWSPDNPNGELRGKDEWERIGWDEALDYIAAEMKKAYDNYGPKSILAAAYSDIGDTYFDPVICLLNAKGGAVHHELGTVSLGSWPIPEMTMTGGMLAAPDSLSLQDSDLHIMSAATGPQTRADRRLISSMLHVRRAGKSSLLSPGLIRRLRRWLTSGFPFDPARILPSASA